MFTKTEGFFLIDCFLRELLGKMCMRELIIRRYHFIGMPRYGDAFQFYEPYFTVCLPFNESHICYNYQLSV